MRLTTFAEVFTSDHPLYKAYQDGFKKMPGHRLRDVLEETGGRYEISYPLSDRVVAAVEGATDEQTTSAAEEKMVRISLEHLRGHDPDTTRIVYGCKLVPDLGPARS